MAGLAMVGGGCDRTGGSTAVHADHDHAHDEGDHDHTHDHVEGDHTHDPAEGDHTHAQGGTRRAIAIPRAVRSNLGLSFIEVEHRRIESTLRVPGQFEYLPTAHREYRTMLPGRVELLVEQFERVGAGELLYRLDSPAWRELQKRLAEAEADIGMLATRLSTFGPLLEAHHRHEQSLAVSLEIWAARVEQLEQVRDAGGGRLTDLADARAQLAKARADLASVQEKSAELEAARAETTARLAAARDGLGLLLESAAAFSGHTPGELAEPVAAGQGERPRWRAIRSIEVRAAEPGIVEGFGVPNGAWADERAAVVTIVRPDRLRFHAVGLQSDLGALRDGLEARVVPSAPTATGRAVGLSETMAGRLTLGLSADASSRTIDLHLVPRELRPWARAGVAAQLEIVTDTTAAARPAVPLAAVQQDGITPVLFRRDPANPDSAIRTEVELGPDDGRWVAVLDGLGLGDAVVLDGSFQLMLATAADSGLQQGGHFHADGTFHAGDHDGREH